MVKLFISATVITGLLIGAWFYFMGDGFGSFGQFGGQNSGPPTVTLQKPKVFQIGNNGDNPLTILATTLPKFALNLKDGKYNNIWVAHAQEQQSMVKAQAINEKGDADLTMTTQFDAKSKQLVVTPVMKNSFKPGMYQLSVKVKTVTGKDITVTQDFAWGVLAINTNKAIYQPGDDVTIGMTVLDNVGMTKCIAKNGVIIFGTAKVALTVTSPSGKILTLSTDDGSITGSLSCKDRSYSESPDFLAKLTDLKVPGRYKLHMEATTVFGTNRINSFFVVQTTPPAFDIERVAYPTRIYPRYKYSVTVDVTPAQDYSGSVYDIVPASFEISGISGNAIVIKSGDYQKIQWQVNWQAGKLQTLSYTIKFPQISPEYYLVGPLTIGSFTEGNEWQVASDSIFNFVQEAQNVASSGNSLTATMSTGVTSGDLLVMNCYKATSSSNTTTWISISGWTRSYRGGTTNRRFAQFYQVVSGAEIGATAMTCNVGGVSAGEIAVEVMEFSGNAITAPKDKSVDRTTGNVNCGTTADVTQNMTPTNPDELMVTQFLNFTNGATANSHTTLGGTSQGFTDDDNSGGLNGFFATGGTYSYDSAWAETINNPEVNTTDTVIWSAGGSGNCLNAATDYNPTISISQGSYRFFFNQDSIIPGAVAAAQNTPLTLSAIGEPFRVRMLLEVDSTNGTQVGLQSLDLNLQFAPLPVSGLCSAVANTDWTPVATVGATIQTDVAWNQNPSVATSGALISATLNDPSDAPSYTNFLQSYYQDDFSSNGPNNGGIFDNQGDITNDYYAIANNQSGEWDFSLVDNTGGAGVGSYCLELATAGNLQLSAYRQYPEITFAKAGVVIRGSFNKTVIKGTGGAGCIAGGHGCGTKIK